MKKLLFAAIIGTLQIGSTFAHQRLEASLDNLKDTFKNDKGISLSFKLDIPRSLVVQCNNSYGLLGLSDENYVDYNRISPALTLTPKECSKMVQKIKAGQVIVFTSKKTEECNYFGCKYDMSYHFKSEAINNGQKTVTGDLSNLSRTFEQENGIAMRFQLELPRSLVIQCNKSYGLIGLSDKNYVNYNRVTPAVKVSSEQCYDAINKVKNGKTLVFSWKKTQDCTYFGCKYDKSYSIK